MSSESLEIRELPQATVEDFYGWLSKRVSQVVAGPVPKVTLMEIASSGNVAVRRRVMEFPDGPKRIEGKVIRQAAEKLVEDLAGGDSRQERKLKGRRQRKPESKDYWRIEVSEFNTRHPDVVCRREDFYDETTGSSGGMILMVVNKQPRSRLGISIE